MSSSATTLLTATQGLNLDQEISSSNADTMADDPRVLSPELHDTHDVDSKPADSSYAEYQTDITLPSSVNSEGKLGIVLF